MVFYQVLDGLSGCWAFLDYVKDNHRTPLMQCHAIDKLELHEKVVAVGDIVHCFPNGCGCISEVNHDVTLVFIARKLLRYG